MRSLLAHFATLSALLCIPSAYAQPLDLNSAIALAREKNGSWKAAELNVRSAESSVRQSRGAFLPEVTPTYRYDTNRLEQWTGLSGTRGDAGSSLDVTATWRLLDNGTRQNAFRSSRLSLEAEVSQSIQTQRQIEFSVIQNYFEALRSQELVRVQKAQVERADTLLKRTLAEIEVKRAAGIDRFQPQADLLNAQVSLLNSESRQRGAQADLKAVLGLPLSTTESLELQMVEQVSLKELDQPLEAYQALAIQKRPDLLAQRSRIDVQANGVRLAQLNAGINYRLDATYTRAFARDVSDRRALALVASIPLFDGGQTKEEVKGRKLNLEASQSSLRQQELQVQSEVESAYYEYQLSSARLAAAEGALLAAQKNYESVSAARQEGAASLVDVVVAGTTLTTAEVNRVQAIFDALIVDARWKLVTGAQLWP